MNIPDRIYYLLQRYAANNASTEELDELTAWLNDPQCSEAAAQYLLQDLQQTPPLSQHSEDRLQKLWQLLKSNRETEQDHREVQEVVMDAPVRKKWIGIKRTWYAAAAVLLVTLTFIAIGRFRKEGKTNQGTIVAQQPSAQQNDLMPGGEKAILTLADGSTIVLDSAANGTLANQGGASIRKLENGQLQYSGTGKSGGAPLVNTMRTPRGGKYYLQLSDGTNVWLNAASSITYPVLFTGNERCVTITGEAYFEVAKNAGKSFIVKVNGLSSAKHDMEIEVLGTHFNINAYADEPVIRTTLLEGSVKVSTGHQNKLLRPAQQAAIPADYLNGNAQLNNPISILNNTNPEEAIAWKNGYFHFDRADIKTVMRQISRWYDVEVQYEGPIPTDTFIGDLPMNSNASQVLKALENVQVHFRIEGKKIIVAS